MERGRNRGCWEFNTDFTSDLSFRVKGLSGMFLERFLESVPLVFRLRSRVGSSEESVGSVGEGVGSDSTVL